MKSPYQIAAFSAQCLLDFVCPRALKSGHTWTPPIRHCTSARVLCAASRRVFWVILCVLCLTSLGFGQEQAADAHGGDRTAASLTGGTASSFTVIGSQADLINNTELHKGEPAESAQGVRDANYWVAEMDKIQKSRAPIQDELAEIQKKIQETDQPELRDKVNRTEQFLVEVNRLRAEASNYVKPEFAQTLDWVAHDAAERLAEVKSDLSARQRESAQELIRLKSLAEKKRRELELNSQMLAAVMAGLENSRADHARQAKIEELNSLGEKQDEKPQAAKPVGGTQDKKHL